ncbi:MAG: hypothetical protein ABIE03_03790 [Patescibacteria group bacterium]|nr:hypothetical protein [Patescibacteria group bacterium]
MKSSQPTRKLKSFRPSFRITLLQGVVIFITLAVIAAVPASIEYLINSNHKSSNEVAEVPGDNYTEQFIVKLPVTGTDIDLSAVKKNPQLITYAGLGFISVAILVGMSFAKNMLGKKPGNPVASSA